MSNDILIGDSAFSVGTAIFNGSLSQDELSWGLDVWAKDDGSEYEGMYCTPRVYSENLLPVLNKKTDSWKSLLSEEISWNKPYSSKHDENYGGLYVFEHFTLDASTIIFKDIGDKQFSIVWNGEGEVSTGEVEKFSIECDVTFIGIMTGISNESKARQQLEQYMPSSEFSFGRHEDNERLWQFVLSES